MIRSISKSAVLPLRLEEAHSVVRDLPRYPEFIPWCESVEIASETDAETTAVLDVRAHHLHASMTTRNTYPGDHCIMIEQLDGPFRTFEGIWTFEELISNCRISFNARFEFKRRYLDYLLVPVLEPACRAVLGSFEQRGRALFPR